MLFCIEAIGDFRPDGQLADAIRKSNRKKIVIETTTLGFVEILYLVDAAKASGIIEEIDFVYVEPEKYNEVKTVDNPLPHNFLLSKSLGRLIPIPGYTRNFTRRSLKTHLVAFLGFEPSRLGRVLEDDEGANFSCYSVGIGVPPFVPGWEVHTFETNSAYLVGSGIQNICYFSANNPFSAYTELQTLSKSLGSNERMVIAPFGTKPAGIGAIVYAVENKPDCGLIYDHPVRHNDRSVGIGQCHIFKLACIA